MNAKIIEELRQKYIKNPPEGMSSKLVRDMADSDLLDMHYFLIEDDDLDNDEFEEGFYIDLNHRLFCHARLRAGIFYQVSNKCRTFLLSKNTLTVLMLQWSILSDILYIFN